MSKAAPSRRAQGGAVSVLAALTLGLVVTVAALALDIGHMFWVKRDMQKAADLAALSAATDLANALPIAQRVALANGFDYQDADSQSSLMAAVGYYDFNAQTQFTQKADIAQANAVQVTLNRTTKYFFLPGEYQAPPATAVAMRQPTAGFSLGSYIARLSTTDNLLLNAVLGSLEGGSVNLSAVDYQGLAGANVSLLGLKTALGLATIDDLLNASLSLEDLFDAAVSALNSKGDAASVTAAGILGSLRGSVSPSLPSLKVGDLLKVDAGNAEAAAAAQVNVLQLATVAAQIANANSSGSPVTVPVGLNIPLIASTQLAVAMVDRPAIAIGPAKKDDTGAWVTRAHGGQLRARLQFALLQLVAGGVVNLQIYIEGGAADAALTGIQCQMPLDSSVVTIQTQPQTLAAYIGQVSDAAMQNRSSPVTVAPATLLNVLGLVRVTGYTDPQLAPVPAQELHFSGPFDASNTQSVAGTSLGIAGLLHNQPLHIQTEVLGIPLPGVINAIVDSLLSVIGAVLGPVLDSLLIDPLLSGLGVQLGGGDVTAFYLDCAAPQLVQ